jgi:hypothetical protein
MVPYMHSVKSEVISFKKITKDNDKDRALVGRRVAMLRLRALKRMDLPSHQKSGPTAKLSHLESCHAVQAKAGEQKLSVDRKIRQPIADPSVD